MGRREILSRARGRRFERAHSTPRGVMDEGHDSSRDGADPHVKLTVRGTRETQVIQPDEIRSRILRAMPDATIDVRDLTGTMDHYEVRVVAKAFEGRSQIERHRMVYGTVQDVMGGELHALSLKT